VLNNIQVGICDKNMGEKGDTDLQQQVHLNAINCRNSMCKVKGDGRLRELQAGLLSQGSKKTRDKGRERKKKEGGT